MDTVKDDKTVVIYDAGLKGIVQQYLDKRDVDSAIKLFSYNESAPQEAFKEYVPETHEIMARADKKRRDGTFYETNKLPFPWQAYVNEIETFFMCANPPKLYLGNNTDEAEGLSDAMDAFNDFLDRIYFYDRFSEAKTAAGAETECAMLYQVYVDDENEFRVRIKVLKHSDGHQLYTLFNRYGELVSFADGYAMQNVDDTTSKHLDIYMKDSIYECVQQDISSDEWAVNKRKNVVGKIPVVYIKQPKAWEGLQKRIDRDEWLDSKEADTCEYFNDPYLKVSADLVNDRLADAESVGKVVKVQDANSVFEFIAPPDSSDMATNEKAMLRQSILDGTFTPDLSYKSIMGLGTLSGEAMRRMSMPGYIKRSIRMRIYNEVFQRTFNLVKSILIEVILLHDSILREKVRRMKVRYELQDPFENGLDDNSEQIQRLVTSNAMSLRTAASINPKVKDPDMEVEQIMAEKKRLAEIEAAATPVVETNNTEGE